jgi:PIN domain nuclease of toxin-antitoxin system
MQYLLDTHTLLWFSNGNERLPEDMQKTIRNRNNAIYVSIVSLWEIAIKMSIGKLNLDGGFESLTAFIAENMITVLPITLTELQYVLALPFHHRDPFDRLLVATSLASNIPIITVDEKLRMYDTVCIW